MTMANHTVTSVSQLHALHRDKERVGFGLDGLCQQAPGATPQNRRQRIVDRVGLTEGNNSVIARHGLETLADQDAVLVIDETGFLKQGRASCGVGRQYTGSAGKITNCQIGVFAAYVSRHGHVFIDRALHLPKGWTDDPACMTAAHVPPATGFATKPQLAAAMIERTLAAGVPFA